VRAVRLRVHPEGARLRVRALPVPIPEAKFRVRVEAQREPGRAGPDTARDHAGDTAPRTATMTTYATRRRRQRGFTLVELIIALAIVGALLVVAFGGLRVAVSAWKRGDEHTEAQQHTRSLTVTLARAVGAAYPYRAPRREGETPALLFRGQADRIEFVTPASPFPTGVPAAFTAVVIELGTNAEKPALVVRQRILPNHEPFTRATIIFDDPLVTTLALSYLGDNGWQPEWDADAETALPRAIKLALGTLKTETALRQGVARELPALTISLGGSRK